MYYQLERNMIDRVHTLHREAEVARSRGGLSTKQAVARTLRRLADRLEPGEGRGLTPCDPPSPLPSA